MKKTIVGFLLCCFLIGCTPNIKWETSIDTNRVVATTEDYNKDVAASMNDMSKEDVTLVYKQFSGLSNYMSNAGKKVDSTLKLFSLIDGFQEDYNYVRGKNVAFADALEKYLKEKGYEDPKNIVLKANLKDETKEIAREKIISDMQNLANAAKVSLELRNGNSK